MRLAKSHVVVAAVAFGIGVTASAGAANLITDKQIKDGSVGVKDLSGWELDPPTAEEAFRELGGLVDGSDQNLVHIHVRRLCEREQDRSGDVVGLEGAADAVVEERRVDHAWLD
jgi:hypothetical protein